MSVLQELGNIYLSVDTAVETGPSFGTADSTYIGEVIAVNHTSDDKLISVYVVQAGDESIPDYKWIIRDLPLPGNNAYTTTRFAVNTGSAVYVAGSADISFTYQAMNQLA